MITRDQIRKAFADWTHPRQAPQGPPLEKMVSDSYALGPLQEPRSVETEMALSKTRDVRRVNENVKQCMARLQIGFKELNQWGKEKLVARAILMEQNGRDEVGEPKRPAFQIKQEADPALPRFIITD